MGAEGSLGLTSGCARARQQASRAAPKGLWPTASMYGTVSFMSRIVHATVNSVVSAKLAALSKLSCQPGAGRGAAREAAICQAVVELLNETSYESVTMDAVAARAKASKATIYRRWSNKDELVVQALQGMIGRRDLPLPDTGNLRDDIVAGIAQHMNDPVLAAINTASLKVLIYAASSDPALATQMREAIRDVQLTAWQIVLHRGHARGELQCEVDAGVILEVIQGQFCARTGVEAQGLDAGYVQHIVDDVMMPVILHAGSAGPIPQVPATNATS